VTLESILVERRDCGAWLKLNRPDKLNAFNPEMIEELDQALGSLESDPTVQALVITGVGRAFCVGGDLDFVADGTQGSANDPRTIFLERLRQILHRLENFPQPTIAAINGITLAGGLEIVLCCDLVLAADTAEIGDGHAVYGLIPGGGATARLARRIGPSAAKYLLFSGLRFKAEKLASMGLVNEVVPAAELEERTQALVAAIGSRSPETMRRVKRLANDSLDQSQECALTMELLASEAHARSYDMTEGVKAFIEKRRPKFLGR